MLAFGASAAVALETDPVIVAGKVIDKNGDPVPYPDVRVVCEGFDSDVVTGVLLTEEDGSYSALITPEYGCTVGSTATVEASKEGVGSGVNSKEVMNFPTTVDVAIINVQIPEFATVSAGLALLGAGAAYAYRRRDIR